jgi:hypothetical protein
VATVASLLIGTSVAAAPPAYAITSLAMAIDGGSEPAVTVGPDGQLAVDGLRWTQWGIDLWTGPFGSAPAFRGSLDVSIPAPGRFVGGGFDGDIDTGSTGTLHEAGLEVVLDPACATGSPTPYTYVTCPRFRLAVSATSCPPRFASLADCRTTLLDTTYTDRPWITSDGATVYLSYQQAPIAPGASERLTRVWRSDDDGYTWKRTADPTPAGSSYGAVPRAAGPIVADPSTHDVFVSSVRPDVLPLAGAVETFVVSRSSDGGRSWTPSLVYRAAPGVTLRTIFPALAVDPVTGQLYAAWSDGNTVSLSTSSDHGVTWTSPIALNAGEAATAVFPWIAAHDGTVDVVYYGTAAASKDDPTAVWNVFAAKSTDGGATFTQNQVSDAPNHVGAICTNGSACPTADRTMLDLFEVALDPRSGKAAIAFTDDHSVGTPDLPQVVLAQEQ